MTAAFYQNEVKFFVAVDCIILGFNSGELNVLLYKRNFEPLKGQWSLMGGFIKSGESVNEAASRVLTGYLRSILFISQYERFQSGVAERT